MLAFVAAAIALLLGGAVAAQDAEPTDGFARPPIEGRYGIVSAVGGAVWTFLSDGQVMLIGPGDLMAEGRWQPAAAAGTFDASIDIAATGQTLTVLGGLAPDGRRVALHVAASTPLRPGDGVPWPPESRIVGERVGLVGEGPDQGWPADQCLRPVWESKSVVDWDPCAAVPLAALLPPPSPSASR
jgi:hypothetical protein